MTLSSTQAHQPTYDLKNESTADILNGQSIGNTKAGQSNKVSASILRINPRLNEALLNSESSPFQFTLAVNQCPVIIAQHNQTQSRELLWLNVINPSRESLVKIAAKYKIQFADLEQCLQNDKPPEAYRYKNYLVCHYDEISFNKDNPQVLDKITVSAVLNDHYLITLAQRPSKSLEHVRKEIQADQVVHSEISTSNYLMSRIIGCAVHFGEDALYDFERSVLKFCKDQNGLADSNDSDTLREIGTTITDTKHSLQRFNTIIHTLQEQNNLFGSSAPKDSLGRYAGMLCGSMGQYLDSCSQSINAQSVEWGILRQTWNNIINLRISMAVAMLGPSALWVGTTSALADCGLKMSLPVFISGLVTTGVISAGLIYNLHKRKKTL